MILRNSYDIKSEHKARDYSSDTEFDLVCSVITILNTEEKSTQVLELWSFAAATSTTFPPRVDCFPQLAGMNLEALCSEP